MEYNPERRMIQVTGDIYISEKDLVFKFIRASGPGGQNVNKVSSAVQLRFDIENCGQLTPEVKNRLKKIGGYRVSSEGILVIEAKRYRNQEKNRQDSVNRLLHLIRKALEKPRKRIPTKKTRASDRERLDHKKKRGDRKKARKRIISWDE